MFKHVLWSFLTIVYLGSLSAQTDIKFDVKNYTSDTLIFGYYLADKLLVKDSIERTDASEPFTFQQDSLLEPGMYIVVSIPEGLFYQVLVGEEDQEFVVTIDTLSENEITFEGSPDNDIFYDYLHFVNDAQREKQRLDRIIVDTDSVLTSVRDQLFKDRMMIERLVQEKQRAVIQQHPNSIAALLIKSNFPFNFPEFEGTPEEVQRKKYVYYKAHYFDDTDLKHPAMLRTPVVHQRINYYLENLTPVNPDSAITSVDYLLSMMDPDSEMYRYYLSYFLNKYGNSKYIGMDAVYVHLALNYYGKGKAPWVTEENKQEIVENALKIEPILIGKKAPDFTISKQDGTPLALSDLTNAYTVLVFWKPNCSHCTKAMPHIIEFNEKYKDKGVDVVTICTQIGKDYEKCWEDVEKKGMGDLLNAGDPFGKSRILSKYYATSTPKIFILDKDKNIRLKKVPAENLDAVLQQLLKIDAENKETSGQ